MKRVASSVAFVLALAVAGTFANSASAAEDKGPEILDGTIIEFQKDVPLRENRDSVEAYVITEFSSRNIACDVGVHAAARSQPYFPAGSRYKVLWGDTMLRLVNPTTGQQDAEMFCAVTGNTNADIFPGSDSGHQMYESTLKRMFPIKVVGGTLKLVPVGGVDPRHPGVVTGSISKQVEDASKASQGQSPGAARAVSGGALR